MGRLKGWRPLAGPPSHTGRAFVFERRADGQRIHTGGLIVWPDKTSWSIRNWTDTRDPLWQLACQLEPTPRRALMLFADLKRPAA